MRRIYVGVAWPYANAPQHIGQLAGNALPADIFARFHRLRGNDVLMVSGSDMHGTPVTVRAEAEGVTPAVVANRVHEVHVDNFRRLGISFDLYTHTETEGHQRTAQEIFLRLLKKGLLVKQVASVAYCPHHARFLPDRYLTGTCPFCGNPEARGDECDVCSRILEPEQLGNPRCRLCGTPAEFRPTEHFYLDLPSLAPALANYHQRVQKGWRPSVRRFTENYVADGLRRRPITRDISWGIPLPLDGYEGKRLYVWFEAVMGYLSASQEWARHSGEPDAWKRYWEEGAPVEMYNFMGKDNIAFHTVFWPAILLGLGGLHLPDHVEANEHMQTQGRKLSKSRSPESLKVTLPDLLAELPPDVIRFYAAYHAPQNHDTEFDPDELREESAQILADQYGNLVQRTLTLVERAHAGRVPTPPSGWEAGGSPAGERLNRVHPLITGDLEAVRLKEALDRVLELVRETNRSFHEAHPWSAPEPERSRILFETLWTIKALSRYFSPFLPFSSDRLARMMGEPNGVSPGSWEEALVPPVPGTPIGPVQPLFPKEGTLAGPSTPKAPPGASPSPEGGPVVRETPLDIRAGKVLQVEPHPRADRLYVLTLDLGEPQPRSVVAGLKAHYAVSELSSRTVAVLANLAPRPLRGITSQGMVLAAEGGDVVGVLLAPDGTPPGTRLEGSGEESLPIITHEAFSQSILEVAIWRPPPAGGGQGTLETGQGPVPWTGPDLGEPGPVVVRRRGRPTGPVEPLRWATGAPVRPARDLPAGARVR
jgi:methionyl-tRNA synthetase